VPIGAAAEGNRASTVADLPVRGVGTKPQGIEVEERAQAPGGSATAAAATIDRLVNRPVRAGSAAAARPGTALGRVNPAE
jgi:hypothetical protein